MERLNAGLQALVDAERTEAEPSPADLERARLALLRRVGTAAATGAAVGALAKSAQAGAAAAASGAAAAGGAGLALKLGLSAIVLGGVTAVLVPRSSGPGAPSPQESAPLALPAATFAIPPTSDVATLLPPRELPAAPRVPTPSEAPAVRAKRPAPGPSPAEQNAPPLAEEVRLLKEAQAALKRGNASAALAALAEHQRRFPGGQLALERSAVHISALCALGRTDEARRAARSFLERHASSGLAEQVRGSCAGAGTPSR